MSKVTQLGSEVGPHPGLSNSKAHALFYNICVLVIFWDSIPLFRVPCNLTQGLDWIQLVSTTVASWLFHTRAYLVGEGGERLCPGANEKRSPG